MDKGQGFRSSPIEGLPVEVVRMVLSALSDVMVLQVAVLSCPLFYTAFLQAEASITTSVLLNQVDITVLPEAIAAFESSLLNPDDVQNRQSVLEFVEENIRQRPALPTTWSLKKALRLGRFHFYVEQFTKRFVEMTLTTRSAPDATLQEECRIQRALYRFEIYRNLFHPTEKAKSIIRKEQSQLFFANFASWENEQLGCIHDFLFHVVSPAFNDVVEHDIAWGVAGVEYGDEIDAPDSQYILSLGLETLYRIMRAETYEDRERVLCSGPSPLPLYDFLHEGLSRSEDQERCIERPYFDDPDSGPADAWWWAHQEDDIRTWYLKYTRKLREWGYVMWDRVRLEGMKIPQVSCVHPTEDAAESLLEQQEIERQRMYLRNSQDQRIKVSRRGGSGWWSWGDESKVRWKDGKAPTPRTSSRYVPSHVKPTSLGEARELLSMMKIPSIAHHVKRNQVVQ